EQHFVTVGDDGGAADAERLRELVRIARKVNEDDVEETVDAAIDEAFPARLGEPSRGGEWIHVVADVGQERRLTAEEPKRKELGGETNVANLHHVRLQGGDASDYLQPSHVVAECAGDAAELPERRARIVRLRVPEIDDRLDLE